MVGQCYIDTRHPWVGALAQGHPTPASEPSGHTGALDEHLSPKEALSVHYHTSRLIQGPVAGQGRGKAEEGKREMGSLVSLGQSNVQIFLISGSFMTSPECVLSQRVLLQHSEEVTIITTPQTMVLGHEKITSRASERTGDRAHN